jgi:hypothetical protein
MRAAQELGTIQPMTFRKITPRIGVLGPLSRR